MKLTIVAAALVASVVIDVPASFAFTESNKVPEPADSGTDRPASSSETTIPSLPSPKASPVLPTTGSREPSANDGGTENLGKPR